jgi:Dak1 domain
MRKKIFQLNFFDFYADNSQQKLFGLDSFPGIKVIMNRQHNPGKVANVLAGGLGHALAHAGCIGKDMLAAVVYEESFASPSVNEILACVFSVAGKVACDNSHLLFQLLLECGRSRFFKQVGTKGKPAISLR